MYGVSETSDGSAAYKDCVDTEQNMKDYWQVRAESFGFNCSLIKELAYTANRYLPEKELQVLDVGCGTGIVTAAMASLGHRVTAVDLCSNMLEKTKENLQKLGLMADLICYPADILPFEDNTFDVVVSRNLIWALPEPEKTLREWRRVLRPAGMLLYWDGNHYRYLFDKRERQNRQRLIAISGSTHPGHVGKEFDSTLCDETALFLPLSGINRPSGWDEKMLPALGFDILGEEIRHSEVLLKYGETEGFYTTFFIAAKNGRDWIRKDNYEN